MTTRTRLACLASLAATAGASASIVGFTGPVEQITPPAFVTAGISYATFLNDATVWDEKQGVALSAVPVDMVNNPGSSATAVPGTLTGAFDSHYFHYRHNGPRITGTITFSGPIVGVSFDAPALAASDALVAPAGTTYDPTPPRGIDLLTELISINGNTLTFDVEGGVNHFDTAQFRVFTAPAPAPGTLALACLGALAAPRRRRRA